MFILLKKLHDITWHVFSAKNQLLPDHKHNCLRRKITLECIDCIDELTGVQHHLLWWTLPYHLSVMSSSAFKIHSSRDNGGNIKLVYITSVFAVLPQLSLNLSECKLGRPSRPICEGIGLLMLQLYIHLYSRQEATAHITKIETEKN